MDEEPPSNRNALLALLVVVALVVAGFWISRVLRDADRTEDCLMRGGHNCAPLDSTLRR
jgi:hypothetical protein